jgi:hypothetical protein
MMRILLTRLRIFDTMRLLALGSRWGFHFMEIAPQAIRIRLTSRCSERLPAVRSTFPMIKPLNLRAAVASGRRR